MRAVDSRLKAEWIQWAENGTCSKDIQDKQHRLGNATSMMGETTDTTGKGLARIYPEDAAASLGPPSVERGSLLQRRRRRLRAWCSEVCVYRKKDLERDIVPETHLLWIVLRSFGEVRLTKIVLIGKQRVKGMILVLLRHQNLSTENTTCPFLALASSVAVQPPIARLLPSMIVRSIYLLHSNQIDPDSFSQFPLCNRRISGGFCNEESIMLPFLAASHTKRMDRSAHAICSALLAAAAAASTDLTYVSRGGPSGLAATPIFTHCPTSHRLTSSFFSAKVETLP